MLHLPGEVDPEPVGDLHLLQGVVEELLFLTVGPRPRQLVLVENAEAATPRQPAGTLLNLVW